jgi:choline dehydrogenase-like flavoprotein
MASTFDYIVVGAGSAGCVLANRLTASGRNRVLLLEAGGRGRNIWIHIPLGYGKLFNDARVNWLYSTDPEPDMNNRTLIQPRGKVLGGSSAINGLLYIRGQPQDFDHWRQLGNAGWSFENVLPYFRRAEDQERGADALHGTGGPLAVSNVSEPTLCAKRSSRRRSRQAVRATTISTGPARKARVTSNSPRAMDAAARRQRVTFARQSAGLTSRSRPMRWQAEFCFRGVAPPASNTGRGTRRMSPTRAAR